MSNVVVTSIIIVSLDTHALLDPGFTHSYVSPTIAKSLFVGRVQLEKSFLLATPTGETILVKEWHQPCKVMVGELKTTANLMLLDMSNFDVILGMDWLASCHAVLDCHSKSIKFSISGGSDFIFQGDRSDSPCNLISMIGARRMLRKGCQGFLALVRDVKLESVKLEKVSIVNEFIDVFPEELPGLPSEREIEFGIEVVPGIQPITIPPYRMVPVEVKELRE